MTERRPGLAGIIPSTLMPDSAEAPPSIDALLRLILTSRVYDVCRETPLDLAPRLSARLGRPVLFKREDLQPVFSFKLRGAYNRIAHLSESERERGVIAVSAGNHAQGVAYSASKLGIHAVIVMPQTTPEIKVEAVRRLGAEVVLHGDNYSDAKVKGDELQRLSGAISIHPFDDPLVIAGQGTIGEELLRQSERDLAAVFVAVGGGGLISGIASYIKALRPDVQVIGVEPFEADAMFRSLQAGHRVTLDHVGIFADGVAVREVGVHTFALAQQSVDEVVRVTNDEICAAIKDVFDDTRSIMEPAGALAVAGLKTWVGRQSRRHGSRGRRAQRREHELRPAALRRRTRRAWRSARGDFCRDDSRTPGCVPRVLRASGPPRGHRVQLSARQPRRRAHLRRAGRGRRARTPRSWRANSTRPATRRPTCRTTSWPSSTSATWSAAAPATRGTSVPAASSSPNGPGR